MKIIFDKVGQPKSQADPFIFFYQDSYYIYATGVDGIHCYKSTKLDGDWQYVGIVFCMEGKMEYWAPCVFEEDGKIYMYYSSMPSDCDDVHQQCISVAVSQDPQGTFTYICDLLPPFSIDPHVVQSGNQLFMFYSVNDYDHPRAGTYIVVQKMSSPTQMCGEAVLAVRATLDEEIFMRDRFKVGQHWHTLEGAFYFREGDYHYLIYSGNCYQSDYYYLGYATAYTSENDLTKVSFQKYPSDNLYCPLIAKNSEESGTGHNSMIKVDGKYYCVYHGRDVGTHGNGLEDNRTARICQVVVDNGVLKAIR